MDELELTVLNGIISEWKHMTTEKKYELLGLVNGIETARKEYERTKPIIIPATDAPKATIKDVK